MKDELIVWELIHNKIVTLKELENDYCLDDIYRLNSFNRFSNKLESEIKKYYESKNKNVS